MSWIEQLRILGELLAAALLGGLIGLEREAADKAAGVRTHMLVAMASCLLVNLGAALIASYAAFDAGKVMLRADPLGLIEAVVTGLSFLGAGTIFRGGTGVKGLTTAASILLCGAVGIAVAVRLYLVAVGATALALVVLRLLLRFEPWRLGRDKSRDEDS